MREEYDYTVNGMEDNNTSNGMNNINGYNDFSTGGGSPKGPKKHTGAKIAASLMAMVLVSAGSIGVYRQVTGVGKNTNTTSSPAAALAVTAEAEAVENAATEAAKTTKKAKNVSIITPEETNGGELSTEGVVDKVLPSVVGIEATFTVTSQSNPGNFFNFGGFGFDGFDFGQEQQPQTSEAKATGTGVVITEDGYIVTNAHVIYDTEYGAGRADSISVLLNDEDTYDAEVIGYDTECDIAVLKIQAKDLVAAEFGDSDDLKLGQDVIAIGNPLGFELMDTVTRGIISGLNRDITINDKAMTLLQTDAAINSGNSGGPLVNKNGQVIGINSSKMSASYSETSIEGIGFAIPSNEVAKIVDDIMEFGYVTGKPQLGISCQNVTETISKMYNLPIGIYITAVTEGSAADKAGLKSGDIIIKVDDEDVTTSDELNAEKNKHKAGESMELTYVRSGNEEKVTVTLDEAAAEKE